MKRTTKTRLVSQASSTVEALAIGVALLCLLGALGRSAQACTCVDAGAHRVVLDLSYDEDASGDINSAEFQCAINCLDGDPAPELEAPTNAALMLQPLVLSPSVDYVLDHGVTLPAVTDGALFIDGRGARLQLSPTFVGPVVFARNILDDPAVPDDDPTQEDLLVFLERGVGWTITRLLIDGACSSEPCPFPTGLDLHATVGLRISDFSQFGSGPGISLQAALGTTIDRLQTTGAEKSVVVGDGSTGPGGATAWPETGSHSTRAAWTRNAGGTRPEGMEDVPTTSVFIESKDSGNLVLDRPIFEGNLPTDSLLSTASETMPGAPTEVPSNVRLRSSWIEYGLDPTPGLALFKPGHAGTLAVENTNNAMFRPYRMLDDVSAGADRQLLVSFDGIPQFYTSNTLMAVDETRTQVSVRNVRFEATLREPADWADTHQWIDSGTRDVYRQGTAPRMPRNVRFERDALIAPSSAAHPVDPVVGQLWHDAAQLCLWYEAEDGPRIIMADSTSSRDCGRSITSDDTPDGIDQDCDGLIDEDCIVRDCGPDLNGDGLANDPNGLDDDGDGNIDENCIGYDCGPDRDDDGIHDKDGIDDDGDGNIGEDCIDYDCGPDLDGDGIHDPDGVDADGDINHDEDCINYDCGPDVDEDGIHDGNLDNDDGDMQIDEDCVTPTIGGTL